MIKFIPFILVILMGCGKVTSESSSRESRNTIYRNTYVGTPILLTKQVTTCASYAFAENITLNLNLILSGRFTTLQKNFDGMISSVFLNDAKKQVVALTYYGQVRHYWKLSKDTIGITEYKAPVPVFLCPEENAYEKNSVESAAININYYIQQTYQKVKEAATNIKLGPINVNVAPFWQEYQRTGASERKVIAQTDNAFYIPDLKEITFLPSSRESKRLGSENLWEIPSVIGHEYAHHIFNTIFPYSKGSHKSHGCFGAHLTGAKENENETVEFVLDSLNEGFADLIGFYALPLEERGFTGMGYGSLERNINYPNFNNGFVKKFNNFTLKLHDDTHNVGAIFAYLANKVFQEIGATDSQKINVLLNWIAKVQSNHEALKSSAANVYLEEAYMEFLNTVTSSLNPTDFKVCRHLIDFYQSNNLLTKNGCFSPKQK